MLRAGMPTSSEFSNVVTGKGEPSKSMEKYATTLAAELYAGKPLSGFEGNIWTERGKELEDNARSTYEFLTSREVEQAGFITDDDEKYGCSPDGLVGDNGMTEFKCLKTENHVDILVFYKKYKKCPAKYIQQTQGQLLIAEREWCDLTFYHPELPPLIVRQTPIPDVVTGLTIHLEALLEMRDKILAIIKEY